MSWLTPSLASQRLLGIGLLVASSALIAASPASVLAESPYTDVERITPVVRAVQRVKASVVNIHGQKTIRGTAASFAGAINETVRQVNGMGTGIVIDPRGYLLTNYHVVEDVNDIQVSLADNRTAVAEVIASDERYDLAVLKVSMNEPLPVVPLGTSSDLWVGERVIAIGNAFGYENTVTEGIISALHRNVPVNENQDYKDLIQTSAGINPGNSGGPLLNIYGDVIGINVAVRVGANSIAFAIPIDQAIEVARNIIKEYNDRRVIIGLAAKSAEDRAEGLLVTNLSDDGPAVASGFKPGDRILRVGSRAVKHPLDLELALLELQPGEKLAFDIQRGTETTALEVQATEPQVSSSNLQIASRVWSVIGVRATPLTTTETRNLNIRLQERQPGTKPYHGGLKVASVRPGSPAAQYLRAGDILLGLHKWQTTSMVDLDSIIRHPEIQRMPNTPFYIVRQSQVLEGELRLARRAARRSNYR